MSQRQLGRPPPHKKARTTPYTNNTHNQHNNQHNKQQKQKPKPQQKHPQPQPFHRLLEISQINLLSREVQNWIFEQCALSDHVEIEAKLGKLLTFKELNTLTTDENMDEKGDEIRVHDKIGLKSLAWIDLHKTGGHFESTVNEEVFKHLNQTFNAWYSNCNSPPHNRLPQLQQINFPKLLYKRSRTVDKIYKMDNKSSSIRVTIDMKDPHRIKEVIEKKKKSSMNICYPASKYDIRISASVENVVPRPQRQIVSSLRCKDRISYQYDYFSIDITSTYTYSEGLTQQFIRDVIDKFKDKQDLPLDLSYGTLRTYEVELEIADHAYLSKIRKIAHEQRQFYQIQQLSYFFTQASIQLAELASNRQFMPSVCKLPQKQEKQ